MRNAPKVHAARSRTLLDLLLAAELQRGRARLSGIPVPVVRYLLEEIPGPVRALCPVHEREGWRTRLHLGLQGLQG